MKNQALLYGIIGLLGGSLLTILTVQNAVNNNQTGMMRMMGLRSNFTNTTPQNNKRMMGGMGMNSSMDEMMESMAEKSGDEFDAAFLEAMIVHHQGAIEMAEEAKQYAQHEEIKKLADDIIVAQTKEIEDMRSWQKEWKY